MGTRFDPNSGGLIFTSQEKENEIIVKTKEQLQGTLDSTKVYFVDGSIDMGTIEVEVPSGGLTLAGHGYDISILYSTENNHTLFKTPNAKQTISSDATGGTFTLTFDGQTTSALNWNATAAQVDSALEALSNIGVGDVTVTGGDLPTDIVVEFTGTLAATEVAVMTVTDSTTGGVSGVTVAQTVAGYSGNFIMQSLNAYVSGTSSKIFNLNNSGNFGACEMDTVNLGSFGVTTPELGELSDYRQFRIGNFAAIKYTTGITFNGTFSGMAVTDSILLSTVAGSTFMKEGTNLSITAGMNSNMNALSLTGTSKWCDFQDTNFAAGAVMSLSNFRTAADDAIPNIDAKNIKANYKGCTGIDNTFVGGSWNLTTEAATTITTTNTLVKVSGTTTADLDAHFTMPANNRLQYNGEKTIKVDILGFFQLSSASTESFEVEARHWDDSASSWNDVRTVPCETALKILGDRRGNGTIVANAVLEEGDYIELWVQDVVGTANPTMELESTLTISERA